MDIFLESQLVAIIECFVAFEGWVDVRCVTNARNRAQIQETSVLSESPGYPVRLRDEHVELRGEDHRWRHLLHHGARGLAGEQQWVAPVFLQVLNTPL